MALGATLCSVAACDLGKRSMSTKATLHMFCGKIASGKSSLAAQLAKAPLTVLISEDYLLARLYPGEIENIEDYARSTTRLRAAIGPHIEQLIRTGVSVVLDFQANTPSARAWMRRLVDASGAAHQLHWLKASDEVCKARLASRNASGTHEYQVTEAEFDLFTSYFVPPSPEEGLAVMVHEQR